MHLIVWSYGELRASNHRSRPERLLESNVDGSQRPEVRHDPTTEKALTSR